MNSTPVVGQVWVWSALGKKQILLITRIDGDICYGIALYDDYFNSNINTLISTYIANLTVQDSSWHRIT